MLKEGSRRHFSEMQLSVVGDVDGWRDVICTGWARGELSITKNDSVVCLEILDP